jgi:trehalose synthase
MPRRALPHAFLLLAVACGREPAAPVTTAKSVPADRGDGDAYVRWLEERSMLHDATLAARAYSGSGALWRNPYAKPNPRAASTRASVWFTAYPASTIGKPGDTVLQTLGDPELWKTFHAIGIQGIHTGPMKVAGGVRGRDETPTVDGNFDRVRSAIDPAFGTDAQYRAMTKNARDAGAIVIGDIIPGHSGKGADFRLAERAYKDYPGLYHMVEIAEKDWSLLPPVPAGKDGQNLAPAAVDALRERGYIVGQLPRTIFYEKGVKETDWTATDVVLGVDGKKRRWVYLHYFKEGQPTFNWLDPSFAAQRLVIGDAIHSLKTLGEDMLRLDANGFLGIERGPDAERAWSEGHPLSVTSNRLIAGMVRKLGGFTFQELNLTLEDIREMSEGGPDLSYDFVTRPAYHHALVTGDVAFLRLMLGLAKKASIDPAGLIHALQNHDELTLELVHFWTKHKDETFRFRGKDVKGAALRDQIRDEMHKSLLSVPYNLKASNGVSCTSASLAAASLGIALGDSLSEADRTSIQRAHLLLAMFNAMQPGVFALSGWDLVGATTLPPAQVEKLMADGDTRWINRGAYDLLGRDPSATASASGLPRARALYGALPEQLKAPGSFASQLKRMLEVRAEHHVYESEQIDVPETKAKGLLVMVHRLPGGRGIEVTALNFGRTPVDDSIAITAATNGARAIDLVDGKPAGALAAQRLPIKLAPLEGKALLVK